MRVYREKTPIGPEKPKSVTIISSDDICVLSDDELNNKFSAVKRRIDQARKKNLTLEILHGLEVEYCYLYREISIRNDRRGSHEKYTAQLFGRDHNRRKERN